MDRPILFSAPSVRAILDGSKTQTRRIVRPQPPTACDLSRYTHEFSVAGRDHVCPYGKPGDRLWVRETWRAAESNLMLGTHDAHYRADSDEPDAPGQWRPSIHMPRWASRITLAVESIRVERLHDITEEDAMAEGVTPTGGLDWTALHAFRALWIEINGAESWAANPWVWVVRFHGVT